MFSDILQRFIQKRPIVIMVRILLENFLNADKLDRWFDTVRQTQYTKEILFSSIVGLMLNVVCNVRSSVHAAYRHAEIEASVVALYGKLQNMELTTMKTRFPWYIALGEPCQTNGPVYRHSKNFLIGYGP